MRRLWRALVSRLIPLPPGLVRGLGAVICVVALLGPWNWLWRRASRHRSEPPPAVAVRPAMVVLPAGTFQMGSPDAVPYGDEHPRHEVRLTRRFALSETEVTQENYQHVMGKNPSVFHESGDLPVENVSWLDAVNYCNKLSLLEGLDPCYVIHGDTVDWPRRLDCAGYRLPTEAEWEYAARADQSTEYAGSDKLDEVGWYRENSKGRPQLVASKLPNAWGLYDMSGNAWEWVWDRRGSYPAGTVTDPLGAESRQSHVFRGGSSLHVANYARVANRDLVHPGDRIPNFGFRVARSFPSSL